MVVFKPSTNRDSKKPLYLLSSQFSMLPKLQLLPSKTVWWSPQGLEKVSFLSIFLFPPQVGKRLIFSNTKRKQKTDSTEFIQLGLHSETKVMHKLNSVFKNMVKCLKTGDFHNPSWQQTAWKPTLSASSQTVSSNLHNTAGRCSLFYFGIQQKENRSPVLKERKHSCIPGCSSTGTTAWRYSKAG